MEWKKYIDYLEKQGKQLKMLGIYLAVVLLIFSVLVPFMGIGLGANRKTPGKDALRAAAGPEAPGEAQRKESALQGGNQPDNGAAPPEDPVGNRADQGGSVISDSAIHMSSDASVEASASAESAAAETKGAGVSVKAQNTGSPTPSGTAAAAMIWPAQGPIIQGVGLSYSRTFSDYRYHDGIDIQLPRGTDVVAVLPGTVLQTETTKGEGKTLAIDHGQGWRSVYTHLEEVHATRGQSVKAGQAVGMVGQPGYNEILEGPHLHFILQKDGSTLNPLDYLPAGSKY